MIKKALGSPAKIITSEKEWAQWGDNFSFVLDEPDESVSDKNIMIGTATMQNKSEKYEIDYEYNKTLKKAEITDIYKEDRNGKFQLLEETPEMLKGDLNVLKGLAAQKCNPKERTIEEKMF